MSILNCKKMDTMPAKKICKCIQGKLINKTRLLQQIRKKVHSSYHLILENLKTVCIDVMINNDNFKYQATNFRNFPKIFSKDLLLSMI